MQLHVRHRHAPGSGSLSARAWAWMHQFELDRQLADGADPASSPALQTRAGQLQAMHCRRHLVDQIDAALAKADDPPHWRSVCVSGLAVASCLLNDLQGPLYHPAPAATSPSLPTRRRALSSPTRQNVQARSAAVGCRSDPIPASAAV
jgi:hypothetical protein